jgi:uncharacterized cupin superfamily protein
MDPRDGRKRATCSTIAAGEVREEEPPRRPGLSRSTRVLSDSGGTLPQRDLGADQTGVNFLIVTPGQREAFAHRHRTAEEIYVVLAGTGCVKLDDELVELAPLDAVRVSPGVARSFQAGPDGLEVLIFGPHVEANGEMVHDFWGD